MTPLVRKILRSKNLRFNFRALGREQAFAQIQGELIEIDLKNNIAPVKKFLHEAIHYYNPDMAHADVNLLEKAEWEKLSQKDAAKLYRKLFS